jgi:hypothetical protein
LQQKGISALRRAATQTETVDPGLAGEHHIPEDFRQLMTAVPTDLLADRLGSQARSPLAGGAKHSSMR